MLTISYKNFGTDVFLGLPSSQNLQVWALGESGADAATVLQRDAGQAEVLLEVGKMGGFSMGSQCFALNGLLEKPKYSFFFNQ